MSGNPPSANSSRGLARSRASWTLGAGEGVLLLTALMYFLGHGITNDPYHPWVGSTLKKETGRDVGSRIERLNTRARSYLARALES